MSTALIVVDVQRDFCEGGALAVAGGNKVAKNIANYIEHLGGLYQEIVFTKDWHNEPPDTNGGHFSDTPDFVNSWPVHCVQNSIGSAFHDDIDTITSWLTARRRWKWEENVFYKGQGAPHYSGFQGKNLIDLGLEYYLSRKHVLNVDVVGIAGDYCVVETAVDAKRLGFCTNILPTLVASVKGEAGTQGAMMDLQQA